MGPGGEFLRIFFDELVSNPVSDSFVEASASQISIIVRRLDDELSRFKGGDRHGVARSSHVNKHDIRRLLLLKFLSNILENTIRQGHRRVFVHQSLNSRNSYDFATSQQRASLSICVVGWDGNDPVLREELGSIRRRISRSFRGLLGSNHTHVMHHHATNSLDRNNLFLAVYAYFHGH
mmetsp:Transcript_15250/g.44080  ORF Transcript_15250/g.44080 Transcript_15250/m.44080 type:complete len:178 (+) Transcript_15250:1608-2141(+)